MSQIRMRGIAISSVVLFTLFVLMATHAGYGETTKVFADTQYQPYACVPTATCVTLAYLGTPTSYVDVLKEIPVDERGAASAAHLVTALERRGLFVKTYQHLPVDQIVRYLRKGYCAIVIGERKGVRHAATLVLSNDEMLSVDVLAPPHAPDVAKLQKAIDAGAAIILVGKVPVPKPPDNVVLYVSALCAITALLVLVVVALRSRKRG